MKTGFVFTNYNNSHYTRQVIHSISLNENWINSHVVIVDNASEAADIEALDLIMADYPTVIVIKNKENVGYFKGLNIGIEYLKNNFPDMNMIVIGNNDLIFPPDFIEKLYNNHKVFEKYAVVSPDIITIEGIHQNPHVIEKISAVREFIYDVYYSNYYLSLLIDYLAKLTKGFTDRKDEEQFNVPQTIFQGYGACYILGPLFFENFSSLWAPTFLMGEELFLSKQLEDKNLKIYYEPAIVVQHHDHATVNQLAKKKFWKISSDSHKVYKKYNKIKN